MILLASSSSFWFSISSYPSKVLFSFFLYECLTILDYESECLHPVPELIMLLPKALEPPGPLFRLRMLGLPVIF